MHFGIMCSPVPGHINPLCSIGRKLIQRGHKVTVFSILDNSEFIIKQGVHFYPFGETFFPLSAFKHYWGPLQGKYGNEVLFKTIKIHTLLAQCMCREIPDAAKRIGINAWIIDQIQYQGKAIAHYTHCPFVSVACALPVNRDKDCVLPSPFVPWQYRKSFLNYIKNKVSWFFLDIFSKNIIKTGNILIKGYSKIKSIEQTFSPLAQIIPMSKNLNWNKEYLKAKIIHYIGSALDHENDAVVQKNSNNNRKQIIYISFGTLQNNQKRLYNVIANALSSIDVPLVFGIGDHLNVLDINTLPENPTVYSYADQQKILKQVRLCITHGGMNTVNEALRFGVPLLIIPITHDQPGMAARVVHAKVGKSITLKNVTENTIRTNVNEILTNQTYAENAQSMQYDILKSGGALKAALIIEDVCLRNMHNRV